MNIEEVDSCRVSSNFTIPSSNVSSNNLFAAIVRTGVQIVEIVPGISSGDDTISVRRSLIKTPKEYPLSDLRIDVSKLNREEFCVLNLDSKITPYLEKLAVPDIYTKQVGWLQLRNEWPQFKNVSPSQIVLALLSNHGCFKLYLKCAMGWNAVVDISSIWKAHCIKEWLPDIDKGDFKSVEKQFKCIRIIAFAVCSDFYPADDNQCLLVSVSESGILSFWMTVSDPINKAPILANTFETNLSVHSLHWYSISSRKGWLIITCTDGIVKLYTCEIEDSTPPTVSVKFSFNIWKEMDLMLVSNLKIKKQVGKWLIAFSKENCVLMFSLGEDKVLKENYYEFEVKIAGLDIIDDKHLLAVQTNNQTFDLRIDSEKCLFVERVSIPFNHNTNIDFHKCYGISISANKIWCAFFMKLSQNHDHLIIREPNVILLCSLKRSGRMGISALEILIRKGIPFYQLHDYIEYIRYSVAKSTEISSENAITVNWEYLTDDLETCRKYFQMVYILLKCYEQDISAVEVVFHICNFLFHEEKTMDRRKQYFFYMWLEQNLDKLPAHVLNYEILKKVVDMKNNFESAFLEEKCGLCDSKIIYHYDIKFLKCAKHHQILRCSLSFLPLTIEPMRECLLCHCVVNECEKMNRCVICDNIY